MGTTKLIAPGFPARCERSRIGPLLGWQPAMEWALVLATRLDLLLLLPLALLPKRLAAALLWPYAATGESRVRAGMQICNASYTFISPSGRDNAVQLLLFVCLASNVTSASTATII